jgi:hypothetical protein
MIHTLHVANVCMPTIQNLITIVAGTPTYAIYYFYFTRREGIDLRLDTSSNQAPQQLNMNDTKYRFEVIITTICWLSIIIAISGSAGVLFVFGSTSQIVITLAKIWGLASAITNTIQWIPQLDATWTAQHEGILSVSSLIISVLADIFVP